MNFEHGLVTKSLAELGKSLCSLLQYYIEHNGQNRKTGTNTLRDSDLYDSVESVEEGFVLKILANDYIEYIERGRGVGFKKVPIQALRDWALKKGIDTDNHTLFAIQTAIYNDGIPSRPILSSFYTGIDKELEDFSMQFAREAVQKIVKLWHNLE